MRVPPLSRRMAFLQQSEIRNMTLECARRGGLNLAQGICDTPIPEAVLRAAQSAMDAGYNTYTRYDGVPELREVIASRLARTGLDYDPDGEIIVSNGATGAFFAACLGLFDPGDEIILFEPFYGYHLYNLRALDLAARIVPLGTEDFALDVAALRAAVGPRTRAIVVNTPGNPSGRVFTREELTVIGELAVERDLFVITDEIYEHFVYDDRQHLSPATLPGLRDRTITIGGFSKTLSITGWRIGFSASPRPIAERLGLINDLVYICAPAPLQMGVATALGQLDDGFFEELRRTHQAKRDRICDALSRAGLPPHVPEGAYYVLADTSRIRGATSKDKALHLLESSGVAAVPGEAFFESERGANLARFCFGKTDADLEEACRRLGAFGVRELGR